MSLSRACVWGRGEAGGRGGREERGVCTHANEGDELLIRVFIRAVGRDRRAAPLVGRPCGGLLVLCGGSEGARHSTTSPPGFRHEEPQDGGARPHSAH